MTTQITVDLRDQINQALRYLASKGSIISSHDLFVHLGFDHVDSLTASKVYHYINHVVKLEVFRFKPAQKYGGYRYLWHAGHLRPKKSG